MLAMFGVCSCGGLVYHQIKFCSQFHVHRFSENDIDADIFTEVLDKDLWQLFNIGTTRRLLKSQEVKQLICCKMCSFNYILIFQLWKKMLTEASDYPCDGSLSSTEPNTIIPVKESVGVDAASRAESDTTLPIAELFREDVASWAAVKLVIM